MSKDVQIDSIQWAADYLRKNPNAKAREVMAAKPAHLKVYPAIIGMAKKFLATGEMPAASPATAIMTLDQRVAALEKVVAKLGSHADLQAQLKLVKKHIGLQ